MSTGKHGQWPQPDQPEAKDTQRTFDDVNNLWVDGVLWLAIARQHQVQQTHGKDEGRDVEQNACEHHHIGPVDRKQAAPAEDVLQPLIGKLLVSLGAFLHQS